MSGGSFDAVITNGMASVRSAADAAGRSVDKMATGTKRLGDTGEREFRRIGEAVTKMGGPVADIGGKFFGALGMEGGLARLAIAASVAGIAFRAISAAMDASKARTEALVAATSKLGDAYRNAGKAKDAFASGSAEIGRSKAVAENLFGHTAGGMAERLSNEFKVDFGDVLKAMASTGSIPRAQRMASLRAALGVASTGESSAPEAVARMSDGAIRTRVLSQRGQGRTFNGAPISDEQVGSAVLLQNMRGGYGSDAFGEAITTVLARQGLSGNQLAPNAAAGSITSRAQIAAYDSGATAISRTRNATDATNPSAAGESAFFESQMREVQKLRGQAREYQRQSEKATSDYEEFYIRLLNRWMMVFAENDARRLENATGTAVVRGTGGN